MRTATSTVGDQMTIVIIEMWRDVLFISFPSKPIDEAVKYANAAATGLIEFLKTMPAGEAEGAKA
jgi:hypothetical protein